ncbi:isoprenoid synthase domain-containing protein [Mycena belliarum]|uniref:Isoprenoid synthase domain-containing protein n=1 Tax=Mycena belliarum TaxID=1033014 RepID=A0AAD6TZQ7_9AGAR|nr:isoprenoid synthase domain-containing protein [Mycena belliae]
MPSSPSVQLPDLLGLVRPFDLRTNRHCHGVTGASEEWFAAQHDALTPDECAALRSWKVGLWASTCFPTSDPPQLRLATDFLTLLVTCNARFARAQSMRDCGWIEEEGSWSGWDCLSGNTLFRAMMERVAAAMPSEAWREKFNRSSRAFRAAQTKLLAYRQSNTLPSIETYVDLRRDLSGIAMVFDLIEIAEGLNMASYSDPWKTFKHFAADIIALCTDIFAYNNDQFNNNLFNVVSIICTEQGVSPQGAINFAFALISTSYKNFLAAEAILFQEPSWPRSTSPVWTWNPLRRKQADATPDPPLPQQPLPPDAKLYLRGLKDCVVGTVNWGYETELYFGTKGDEVRQFGWVFLKLKDGEHD